MRLGLAIFQPRQMRRLNAHNVSTIAPRNHTNEFNLKA